MYRRLSAVLFPVMTLLLLGAVYWGYQEHQEKNSILIKAENQYQRAFHDLSYHVNQLHNQIGKTLAVNSTSEAYHRKGLVNVWRLTSQAQNEINQLPLTLLPFNKTEEFLSKMSDFAYKTAVRDLHKEPMSKDELATLKSLYARSEDISKNLQDTQHKVLAQNLRWMDVETALASEKSVNDNTIIDGFKTVDKKVSEYPEINWGPSVAAMFEKRNVRMLSGPVMKPQDIKMKAAKFMHLKSADQVRVTENGRGTEFASYSALISDSKNGRQMQMDFTQRGGKLIYFMDPRSVDKKNLSTAEARASGTRFLETHGYPGMKAVNYDEYGNQSVFTFVSHQNGVLIYPDKLTVKVAMDNGEVIGLQSSDYVYEHHTRKLPKPKLTKAQAMKTLNPEMKVTSTRQALIKNDLNKEVGCYEFTGRVNGSLYRIFVNGDTGEEESIERLPEPAAAP